MTLVQAQVENIGSRLVAIRCVYWNLHFIMASATFEDVDLDVCPNTHCSSHGAEVEA